MNDYQQAIDTRVSTMAKAPEVDNNPHGVCSSSERTLPVLQEWVQMKPTARRGANQKLQFEWWESGVNPTTQNEFSMSIPCRNPQEEDHHYEPTMPWISRQYFDQYNTERRGIIVRADNTTI
jgi:hypothetical protein